jgi:glucose/arabinose dehydrogenase
MKMNCTPIRSNGRLGLYMRSMIVVTGLLIIGVGCKKNDDDDDMSNKTPDMQLVADNMISPLGVVAPPDQTDRLFVFDQAGKIWIIGFDGKKLATPFIDVTSKLVALNPGYDERGLLGLAFHPNYKTNGRFFIYYTLPSRAGAPVGGTAWNNLSRISAWKVSADANLADMNSEQVILEMDDPQSNHNGGALAFGPDGFLYIAIGDGGSANDVAPGHVDDWYAVNAGGNGQDIEANLFGNILRIDVNSGAPYGIPADNPFVNKAGKDEIYAYGFRNPYRFSFDRGGTHQLFVGDAGQVLYEEVSIVTKGGNYGWNVKEGTHCFNAANNTQELASCPLADPAGTPLIDPVIEMKNAANPTGGIATTIIGGNVYRGKELPSMEGKYIFGIYSQPGATPNGQIFVANAANSGLWSFEKMALKSAPDNLGYYLKGFGEDAEGDLYLTVSSTAGPSGTTGKVFKLVGVDQ